MAELPPFSGPFDLGRSHHASTPHHIKVSGPRGCGGGVERGMRGLLGGLRGGGGRGGLVDWGIVGGGGGGMEKVLDG